MIRPISNMTPARPVSQFTKFNSQNPLQKSSQSPKGDTITLSNAAQTLAATLQEARETPVQTAKEASSGDLEARRLLAKEQAAKLLLK